MKSSTIKNKGFTLAELMIMLAVFAILLAATAPIFTVRYKNATTEDVWAFVANDENMDAYSDVGNNFLTAQSFIGITPNSDADVLKSTSSNNTSSNSLYSKLVIRAHDNLLSGDKQQKQLRFKYGNSIQGTTVGGLFAGGGNMLLGGNYKSIDTVANISGSNCNSKACYNSAYGIGALDSLETGQRNTALGTNALQSLTTGSDNTAIGVGALSELTKGKRNTLVGSLRENATYAENVEDNTVVGHDIGSLGYRNTFVGYGAGPTGVGNNNTAVGYHALRAGNVGNFNTAIGSYALTGLSTGTNIGSYNTAVGYHACSLVKGSNTTCIGYKAGYSYNGSDAMGLVNDDEERVFIGNKPYDNIGGVSVLEVHNLPGKTSTSQPRNNAGDSSVIINGNLVVRGQPYFTVNSNTYLAGPRLVGFYMRQPKNGTNSRFLMGWDGRKRDFKTDQSCGGRCKRHAAGKTRKNCTCTTVTDTAHGGSGNKTVPNGGIISYDWSSQSLTNYGGGFADCQGAGNAAQNGKNYEDKSLGVSYSIDEQANLNYAHRPPGYDSCCPNLTSDIRLKDVKSEFKGGLAELRKINIYNFTFKNDADKTPHVGVMAQDLKRVFPDAVTKDENGYYQIRWDEILYAAINAIKTLDKKVENLAARISKDVHRIAVLKKDNAQLVQQVEKLSNELTLLESKTK